MEKNDEFPAGLRMLIVDNSIECLFVLESMFRKLRYEVTKCQQAGHALALLREDQTRFDIVLCELHMPAMDGLKLLEIIGLEMDLPVVMMSSDDRKGVVMKCIIHGACDYLLKPVQMEAVQLIWQHIIRKQNRKFRDFQLPVKAKGILQEDEADNSRESSNKVRTPKKRRLIWTQELHEIFVAALNQLEDEKAQPKKILDRMQAMNVIGLSREQVASHLQKYRLHLRNRVRSSADRSDVNLDFERASSARRFDPHFQSTASSSSHQLPAQNLIISTPQQSMTRLTHDQLSNNIYDSVALGSTHCVPTELSLHDLPQTNLLFQNNVAILNKEQLYRNAGDSVVELSCPISDGDELIYQPANFIVKEYD